MSTPAPAAITQSSQPLICQFCNAKPRFGKHAFCSKRCATQAAAMCNHCHKKPKFQTFDYCGKNCASLAGTAQGRTPNSQGTTSTTISKITHTKGGNVGSQKPAQAQAGAAATQSQSQSQPPLDPVELAKLVAQHVQISVTQAQAQQGGVVGLPVSVNHQGTTGVVASGPNASAAASTFSGPTPTASQSHAQRPVSYNGVRTSVAVDTGSTEVHDPTGANGGTSSTLPANHPSLNPFLTPVVSTIPLSSHNGLGLSNVYQSQGVRSNTTQSPLSRDDEDEYASGSDVCRIPGCGKAVHCDSRGFKMSGYCSMRHREEAVTSGLVPPCILCLGLPQSDKDYFCSRVCREEALNKQSAEADDEDDWSD